MGCADGGDLTDGAVAELADALDLGSSSERSAGSIPVSPILRKLVVQTTNCIRDRINDPFEPETFARFPIERSELADISGSRCLKGRQKRWRPEVNGCRLFLQTMRANGVTFCCSGSSQRALILLDLNLDFLANALEIEVGLLPYLLKHFVDGGVFQGEFDLTIHHVVR